MGVLIFYTLFTLIDLDNETDFDSGWPEWISVCSHLSVHAFGQRLSNWPELGQRLGTNGLFETVFNLLHYT